MNGQLLIAVCATRVIAESDIMQEFLSSSENSVGNIYFEDFNWWLNLRFFYPVAVMLFVHSLLMFRFRGNWAKWNWKFYYQTKRC